MAELPAITSLTREAIFSGYEADCRRQLNTGHLCQLNSDQGLTLAV